MIIGLTGSLAAGKGVVSNFLKENGFVYLSLSDELREIAKERKIELTRNNLQDLGNKLREEYGSGVLAEKVLNKIKNQEYKKAIVDGIRNPAEINVLRKIKNFSLISVDAPREMRFKRLIERNRESDPKTLEDFVKVDDRDKGVGETQTGQAVAECISQANYNLVNSRSLEEMHEKVRKLYLDIKRKIPRPSWDEYFIEIAKKVSARSTCLRRKYGAVIVKDNIIVSTGYNGSARGLENCIDKGTCKREEMNIPSGERYELCEGVHAEQNAIINGAPERMKDSKIYIAGSEADGNDANANPCKLCDRAIRNAQIKEEIYQDKDNGKIIRKLL